jgi:hypothetical protein
MNRQLTEMTSGPFSFLIKFRQPQEMVEGNLEETAKPRIEFNDGQQKVIPASAEQADRVVGNPGNSLRL